MIKQSTCVILIATLPSVAIAQDITTKSRFVGVWLYSGRAGYCFPALKIDTVTDSRAVLGFGYSPEYARIEQHEVRARAQDSIDVKYELTDRDNPITFYNEFTLGADETMVVSLLGPHGRYNCQYSKAASSGSPQP